MAILQTDLLWFSSLQAALADLRKHRFLLEDAYSSLISDPYLKNSYGQKEVENFKSFLDRKIHVFSELRPPDQAVFPSIVIKVGSGNEDAQKDALGDSYQQNKVDPSTLGGAFRSPTTKLGPVTPIMYDNLTGQITFPSSVNLSKSQVFEGQFVHDEINNKAYPIELVLDNSTLLIEAAISPPPNLTNMTIKPVKDSMAHTRRSIWTWENVELSLYASDSVEVMYLYSIVMYALIRYKKNLWDARNFAVSSISYSEPFRASPEGDPNNVYCRTITVSGRVEHSVIESTDFLIEGLDLGFKIADMSTPDAIDEQALNQGWNGENDDDNA